VWFDRTGGDVGRRLAAPPPEPPPLEASLQLFDQACDFVLQCRKALRRDRAWHAALMLRGLEERIVRVASRVRFERARGYDSAGRFADDLPPDLLARAASRRVGIVCRPDGYCPVS
jgi:hypothetical protein